MVSPSRRKGDSFELEVAKVLTGAGLGRVRRQESSGASHPTRRDLDPSESQFWSGFHFNLKRRAGLLVEKWFRESEVQASYGLPATPVLVVRADRSDPLVLLRLDDFVDLVKELVGTGTYVPSPDNEAA